MKCSSEELNNINKFDINYTPNINNPESYNIAGNNKMFELQFTEVNNTQKDNKPNKNTIIKPQSACAEIPHPQELTMQ